MSTKKRLIQEIAEIGVTQKTARSIIEKICGEIEEKLSDCEPVKIENFGRFEIRKHSARRMKNPETGELHHIPERSVVHYKASDNFTDRFNEETNEADG